jgi:hypothetical protein
MKITIEIIPHDQQRPEAGSTVGDWQFDGAGNLAIRVSDLGDPDYEFLIGLHELVEAWLCRKHGVRQEDVDAFDRQAGIWVEPGDQPSAPYYAEHQVATTIERMMSHALGVVWHEYEQAVERCGEQFP